MSERNISPVDIHVGQKVRELRLLAGLSQVEVGKNLGITFQQVQKYESGDNRIGSSKLFLLSQMLDVPIDNFFDDIVGKTDTDRNTKVDAELEEFENCVNKLPPQLRTSLRIFMRSIYICQS